MFLCMKGYKNHGLYTCSQACFLVAMIQLVLSFSLAGILNIFIWAVTKMTCITSVVLVLYDIIITNQKHTGCSICSVRLAHWDTRKTTGGPRCQWAPCF
ncbi:hypothetical protein XELAEV_18011779mg [Xenopus laevis]|uniref:Uncharacterized protein n=1 Tax=Xenopus laevis TaxID=8355 RepID=A0A974HXM8_XENLA|nr:hypothetical protein XELAEV_18011779mg [Xenopus laevis]